MSQNLVIVHTGCANISSLQFAVERLGYKVLVTDDPAKITAADKVFLPGVGAAAAAMQQIAEKGLTDCLKALTQPVLGICLGMQLLTHHSQEGDAECLGLVDTQVKLMQSDTLTLPHMGWNQIQVAQDSPLFHNIDSGSWFYFVHGYCVPVGPHTLASTEYSQPFSASIRNNNVFGVQFHPERSGDAGAQLIKNFIEQI
ncbi:imidazole glycerol phosphate synthase subunit HisH [Planctobacterium marinum]|uniref:imidazole glycerol phosphate synthase subunit HisH n=1 Tax=Planctobacterium marinum TaxID=1631968 RepID=UPI001E5618BF|nr:imidazole glycerol phosphate synthase subunit HisH [Planctobacterium marinum]MCC2605548.1 imidazole glycerol phosphate synthase subunit HisH [Planctobacterium marinum]